MMEDVVKGRGGVAMFSVKLRTVPIIFLSHSERQLCGF
jgi:hypothetical protein